MDSHTYRVVVTTPLYPRGVHYPCRGEPLYTREKAIEVLRKLVKQGHKSDWESKFGCYAEGPGERFLLCDVTT